VTGDAALDLIRSFEGCRLDPYVCPAGFWTVGYGATCGLDGARVTAAHPTLTGDQAEDLLRRDLVLFERSVLRLVRVDLADNQLGALVSFAFNLGAGALRASTLLRRVNAREWEDVPRQFRRWVHAGGRVLPGLVRRRAAEAELWCRAGNG